MTRDERAALIAFRERVQEINRVRGDDEAAHSKEDKLRADVLRFIVSSGAGLGVTREAAAIALGTESIDFARWCS